jgi:hypothetical protein
VRRLDAALDYLAFWIWRLDAALDYLVFGSGPGWPVVGRVVGAERQLPPIDLQW